MCNISDKSKLDSVQCPLEIWRLKKNVQTELDKSKKTKIDLNIIAKIESSNDPKKISEKGARGLHQIMKKTWNQMVSNSKMGVNWSWDDAFNVVKNTKIAEYYMNTEVPKLLKNYGLADTLENRLAAYNWGAKKLRDIGLENAPKETSDYIKKYNKLRNKTDRGPKIIRPTDRKK